MKFCFNYDNKSYFWPHFSMIEIRCNLIIISSHFCTVEYKGKGLEHSFKKSCNFLKLFRTLGPILTHIQTCTVLHFQGTPFCTLCQDFELRCAIFALFRTLFWSPRPWVEYHLHEIILHIFNSKLIYCLYFLI